jgi:hypothetical protein
VAIAILIILSIVLIIIRAYFLILFEERCPECYARIGRPGKFGNFMPFLSDAIIEIKGNEKLLECRGLLRQAYIMRAIGISRPVLILLSAIEVHLFY